MLTDHGRREQVFKNFPSLRKVLEEKGEFDDSEIARLKQDILPYEIYDHYDPIFRLALHIRRKDFESDEILKELNPESFAADLNNLRVALEFASSLLSDSISKIDEQIRHLGQLAAIAQGK